MGDLECVSIREYARRKGCSDTAVRKAIAAGKITEKSLTKHPTNGRPMIYPELADQEWSSNYDPGRLQSDTLDKQFSSGKPKLKPGKPALNKPNEPKLPPVSEPQVRDNTFAAARKAKAVYEAKLKELEYKEKLGQLVDKEKVYKALYEFGQSVQSGLLSIPDRFIDEIIASGTRNEAHLVLQKAITDELLKLTEVEINLNIR